MIRPIGRAAPPKAAPTDMIKASAQKRAKTTRERAETPLKRSNRPDDRREMRSSVPAEAVVRISE
jgi:hypothetical protein